MNTRFVKMPDGGFYNVHYIKEFSPLIEQRNLLWLDTIHDGKRIWTFKTQKERDACVREILGTSSDYTKERQERMKNDTRTVSDITKEIKQRNT